MGNQRPHRDLIDSLAAHLELSGPPPWVVVPELTLGPAWGAGEDGFGRADVWACKVAWSQPCVRIYECKVTRADLLGDLRSGKWKRYLEHCNQFFFAFPRELASALELPREIGVMVLGEKGWRCLRAPYVRPVEIDELDLRAALFNLRGLAHPATPESRGRARRIAEREKKLRERGWELARMLREIGQDKAGKLIDEARTARSEAASAEKRLKDVTEVLKRHGLSDRAYSLDWELTQRAQQDLFGKATAGQGRKT